MNNTYNEKMNRIPFKGAASAMITPFDEKGAVDFYTLEKLINDQISSGMDGIVILGTTSEAPVLTDAERNEIISLSSLLCRGKIKMIIGSGSNDPSKAKKQTKQALKAGADGILAVTPYYNKCNRQGLIEYYKLIADAAEGIPLILYNVPSRTGVEISPDAAQELSQISNIVAYKEAGNDFSKSVELLSKKILPVYSGNDDRTLPLLSCGAVGTISVISNLMPKEIKAICDKYAKGDTESALELHNRYYHLTKAIFGETNPIGIKYAMSLCGMCSYKTRLPLGEPGNMIKAEIKQELEKLGIIS